MANGALIFLIFFAATLLAIIFSEDPEPPKRKRGR